MASFEELLKCSICLDRFTQPKMLPCQHTFCLMCLDDICLEDLDGEKTVSCPTCRRNHNVPKGGVSGFNDNLMALKLLAMSGEPADCSDCGKNQILSDCQHCHEQLCTDCRVAHKFLQSEITVLIQSLKCDSLKQSGDLDMKEVARSLQVNLDTEASVQQAFQDAAHILSIRKNEILAEVQAFAKFQNAAVNGGSERSVADELHNELTQCRSIDDMKALKTALGNVGGILNRIDSCLEFNADLNRIVGFGELSCKGKAIAPIMDGWAASERSSVESTVGRTDKRGGVNPQTGKPGLCGQIIDNSGDQKKIETFPRNVDYTSKKTMASKLVFGNAPLGQTGSGGSYREAALFHPRFAVYAARENAVYCLSVNVKKAYTTSGMSVEILDLSGMLLRYGLSNGDWRIIGNAVLINDLAIQDSGDLLIIENHKLIRSQIPADSYEPSGTTEQALFPICGHAAQIACHGQEYIILDSGKKCLLKFANDGKLVREMKHEKFTQFFCSRSRMCVNQEGRIYVTGARLTEKNESAPGYDFSTSVKWETVLLVLTWDGKLVRDMALDEGTSSHRFDTVPDISRGQGYYKVKEGEDTDDAIIRDVIRASDVCVDADGFVSVTFPFKNRIDVYDPALDHFCTLGDESRPEIFKDPRGVSLMPDGRMVVCDTGNNRVQII